ncbi:MAG: ArsR/SmtB family transcription factor [Casimicrobium sp.]
MTTQPEPRFARIASLIADPSRSRMLALLLSGEARSAGELARAVSITPQTASTHLSQLLDAGLVKVRTQGRHKYFQLADADVARLLETLALVAERDGVTARWETPMYRPLKYARTCYCHLAGELGVKQHRALLERRVLVERDDGALALSDASREWLDAAHFDKEKIATLYRDSNKKRFAYSCMDWSMRRDHLAGVFATALLEHYLAKGWLRKTATHRALAPTPTGAAMFAKLF